MPHVIYHSFRLFGTPCILAHVPCVATRILLTAHILSKPQCIMYFHIVAWLRLDYEDFIYVYVLFVLTKQHLQLSKT